MPTFETVRRDLLFIKDKILRRLGRVWNSGKKREIQTTRWSKKLYKFKIVRQLNEIHRLKLRKKFLKRSNRT